MIGIIWRDLVTLARTIEGEAGGESYAGKVAVATVIGNRVLASRGELPYSRTKRWGTTVTAVCLRPKQFSCWNDDDPNRARIEAKTLDDLARDGCFAAALDGLRVAGDPRNNLVGLSCHYHTLSVSPRWSRGKTPYATIGNHVFFEGIA